MKKIYYIKVCDWLTPDKKVRITLSNAKFKFGK